MRMSYFQGQIRATKLIMEIHINPQKFILYRVKNNFFAFLKLTHHGYKNILLFKYFIPTEEHVLNTICLPLLDLIKQIVCPPHVPFIAQQPQPANLLQINNFLRVFGLNKSTL